MLRGTRSFGTTNAGGVDGDEGGIGMAALCTLDSVPTVDAGANLSCGISGMLSNCGGIGDVTCNSSEGGLFTALLVYTRGEECAGIGA